MKIQMIGMDHSRAPVEIRERFSFTTAGAEAAMKTVCATPGVEGCILLSTCNGRSFGSAPRDLWHCPDSVRSEGSGPGGLPGIPGVPGGGRGGSLPFCPGQRPSVHDSGEDQILAQVKDALSRAREAQCCGGTLEVLFRHAVTGAKRVKSQLLLSTANASAAELAIDRMWKEGYDFAGKRCLVIGNGEMGKRSASALLERGAQVTVTVRQYRSGRVEVLPGCSRIDYGQRYQCLPQCDVVVSATSSPNVTTRVEELKACGLGHDVLFLDFAVPRDIDPEAARCPM